MRRMLACSLIVSTLCLRVTIAGAGPPASAAHTAVYPLDALARTLGPGDRLPCAGGAIPTIAYRGTHIRYHKAVRVHPSFVAHLQAFEAVVFQVAQEHYGRAPRRVRHIGSYNCRRMRRYPDWVSEHALANAIDIAGFDFGPLARDTPTAPELPRLLHRSFRVRVLDHWDAHSRIGAHHASFLRDLVERLIPRRDIFHVLLGPGWPGHRNHFHFDRAPYRVVEGFE